MMPYIDTGVGEGGTVIRGVIFDFGNVISAFDVGKFLRRLREKGAA